MPKITLTHFKSEKGAYRVSPPLVFTPQYDKKKKQWFIEDNTFSMYIAQRTIRKLERELGEEFNFLWRTYARASPNQMTQKARELRQNLLSRISAA